jgi:TonB family protein
MKSKIKTMGSRQTVTDEEIQRYMDFDKLLAEKDKFTIRQKKVSVLRNAGFGLAGIAIGVTLFIYFIGRSTGEQTSHEETKNAVSIPEQPLEAPTRDVVIETIKPDPKTSANEAEPLANQEKKTTPKNDSKVSSEKASGEPVYTQAEPLNGYPDLYAYFDNELTYPQEAIKDSVQGVITVIFSINKAGKAENVQIENSLGIAFDREVLRVMEKMPPWKPASYNGDPVKSKVSLPLTFRLQKLNNKD